MDDKIRFALAEDAVVRAGGWHPTLPAIILDAAGDGELTEERLDALVAEQQKLRPHWFVEKKDGYAKTREAISAQHDHVQRYPLRWR